MAFYSLLVAVVGVLVAVFIPELRLKLGLNPEQTSISSNTSLTNPPSRTSPATSSGAPFAFSVSPTSEHFLSTLNLLGAYEIAIPSDGQWHDTNILIRPNNQLQIGFMKGTEGNVAIRVGDVSGAFNQAQPDDVWFEYNLVPRLRNNRFDHVLRSPSILKVRSSQNNVVIRVEVRQLF